VVLLLATVSCTAGSTPPSGSSPSALRSPASPTRQALGDVRVRLVRIADLFQPVALAERPGPEELYVAQKTGEVVLLREDRATLVLDISGEVSKGGEQGLLGLTFSPDGAFMYLNFTDIEGDTHVTEFRMEDDRPDPTSRREVLFVDQPYSNHNGGHLAFGPDGYLYVGMGDGGSGGDPMDVAQSLGSPLGKMLRIDPRPTGGRPYGIPPDNPFADRAGARPEIWAYGLRNPWRWSFDRQTGDLWIGDVGQSAREEIDFQPGSSPGGENYGWDGYEGTLEFEPPLPEDAVPPVYDYGRTRGASVIGGYVYRGTEIEGLQGAYLFGDFYEPAVRLLKVDEGDVTGHRELGVKVPGLSSFGEDLDGELYALSLGGPVYRLASAS
jgi:glucose/arabinose dehydrogenase